MFGLLAQGALTLGGLGLSIFGTMQQVKLAKAKAEQEKAIFSDEQQQEQVRYAQMAVEVKDAQRKSIRAGQIARAQVVAAGVNQGAGAGGNVYSSGVPGGMSQISADTATNQHQLGQRQLFGQDMFQLNYDIASHRKQEADIAGDMAEAQGYSSLGGSLVSAAPAFGKILNAFG